MLLTFCLYFATLLNFLVAISTQNFVGLAEMETEKYFITKCFVEISKSEVFWRPTVVLKIENEQLKVNFVNNLIKKLNDEDIAVMIKHDINDGTLNATRANYLVIGYFEDCNTLTNFDFNKIEDKVKYLIVIENYSNDICKQNFHGIGNVIGKSDISFFVEQGKDTYKMYTYVPEIDPITCELIVGIPRKINTCIKGILMQKYVFPIKYATNFKKCPIKVGIGSMYPFAMIENKTSLRTYDRLNEKSVKGIDLQLLKIILNHFNVTIDLYYIYTLEENALINKEFIKFVWNGSLEICAGGLYRIYGDTVDYSGVYIRQRIIWMYYAERMKKTWETLISTVDGLYLFMVFYFSYSAVLYMISLYDKEAVSLMRVLLFAWGSLVASTSLLKARTVKQKILNAVYLIMCLHLTVYMNIQLFSFFTIHEPPETYKTNDALMKSGKVPYLLTVGKTFLDDEKYLEFANNSLNCISFDDCAKQSVMHNGMTVVIEEYAMNFQVKSAVNNEARMLVSVESLLTVYYEMIITKGHPIAKKFQKVMERLIEGGIPLKLLTEAVGNTVINKADIATRALTSRSYSCQYGCTLTIEQLSGVFYIVIYGCVASSVIFIVEIISKKEILGKN